MKFGGGGGDELCALPPSNSQLEMYLLLPCFDFVSIIVSTPLIQAAVMEEICAAEWVSVVTISDFHTGATEGELMAC